MGKSGSHPLIQSGHIYWMSDCVLDAVDGVLVAHVTSHPTSFLGASLGVELEIGYLVVNCSYAM